jgi:hypothetical protein
MFLFFENAAPTFIEPKLLKTAESMATPCSVKAYGFTGECFKFANRSQFVTSSVLSVSDN